MNLFKLVTAVHVWMYRSSGGKRGARMKEHDIVLLTTKGRKTGAARTVPVVSFVDGTDRVVIASKGGAPEHPAWFLNLQANPDVTVQVGPETHQADGRRLISFDAAGIAVARRLLVMGAGATLFSPS